MNDRRALRTELEGGSPDALAAAMDLLEEHERICREHRLAYGLWTSLRNQATILMRRGERDAALDRLKEHEALCRQLGRERDLQLNLQQQASLGQEGERDLGSRGPVGIDIPAPHPAADPDGAARLNIEYQKRRAVWQALPWWKRLWRKEPVPPAGIERIGCCSAATSCRASPRGV